MSTEVQAAVVQALSQLGFVHQPGGPPGSNAKFAVTHETLKKLRHLEGRDFEVDSEGNVKD